MKFSPDGRFIIYEAGGESGSDLRLLSVDGTRDTLLFEHPGLNFPLGRAGSGNHFVFASDRTGTLDVWDQVVIAGKAEGPPRLIRQDVGRISPLGFTRNGAFYYELNTSMFDVYVAEIDIQTGKVVSAPKPAARRFVGSNRAPSWSPDGRSLLYWSARPFGDQLLVIQDLPSGKEREVRPALREFIRPAWRPDGKSIVVLGTGPENRRGFYAVDPQSGKATLLVDARRVEVLPNAAWSRDGKTCFAYSGEAIYRVNLESGEAERLFSVAERGALAVALLSLSPDERQLVFQVRNSPRGEVSLRAMPVTGGDARVIFRQQYPQEFHCCRPLSWTPDGSHVVAAQGPLGVDKSEVWLVPINGGEPVKTGLAMPGLKPPHLHPDGRRITFHTGDPGSSEVWVMENFLAPTGAGRQGGAR